MFVDKVKVFVKGGDGGNGMAPFGGKSMSPTEVRQSNPPPLHSSSCSDRSPVIIHVEPTRSSSPTTAHHGDVHRVVIADTYVCPPTV